MTKKTAKKTKTKKRPQAPRLKLWLRYYTDHSNKATFLNKAGSARAAGYKAANVGSFSSIGCQNFNKLKDQIKKWMDDEGLCEVTLKSKLIEGLECTETVFKGHEIKGVAYISHNGVAYRFEDALQSEDAELVTIARQILGAQGDGIVDSGYIIEERTVIPWDIRRKYLELAFDVNGLRKPTKLAFTDPDGNAIEDFTDTQRAARIAALICMAEQRKAKAEDEAPAQATENGEAVDG